MSEKQLEQTLNVGGVYDCKIISAYGHEEQVKGIYLGKITKKCHGLLYRANTEMSSVIKFTKMDLESSVLNISSPIEVYSRKGNEEEHYLELLKQNGL